MFLVGKIKKKIRILIDNLFFMKDFLDYYFLFKKYSVSINNPSNDNYYAQLRRYIHSIEISDVLDQKRNKHGNNSAQNILSILKYSLAKQDLKKINFESINTLHKFIKKTNSKLIKENIRKVVKQHENKDFFMEDFSLSRKYLKKNIPVRSDIALDFISSRRSIRSFSSKKVSNIILQNAIKTAISTPSACNRQPWKIYKISSEKIKQIILLSQNNNADWRFKSEILLITVNLSMYGESREKLAPFIDGGMFSMSLINSLFFQGVDTCPLNLNLQTKDYVSLTKKIKLPKNEIPIMLIAYGYCKKYSRVTKKDFKSINEIYKEI